MRVEGGGERVRGGGDRGGEADWEQLPLEWILDVFCMSFASVKRKCGNLCCACFIFSLSDLTASLYLYIIKMLYLYLHQSSLHLKLMMMALLTSGPFI